MVLPLKLKDSQGGLLIALRRKSSIRKKVYKLNYCCKISENRGALKFEGMLNVG